MFEKGNKLGKGRPRGAKVVKSDAWGMARAVGINPLQELMKLASEETEPDKRFHKMAEIVPYLHAKLKHLDIVTTVQLETMRQVEEFKALPKEQQIVHMERQLLLLKSAKE